MTDSANPERSREFLAMPDRDQAAEERDRRAERRDVAAQARDDLLVDLAHTGIDDLTGAMGRGMGRAAIRREMDRAERTREQKTRRTRS